MISEISEIKRKGKKPNFIDLNIGERWQRYWNTSEETYSKNRMSKGADKARPSTHTRGIGTHYDHVRRLVSYIWYWLVDFERI